MECKHSAWHMGGNMETKTRIIQELVPGKQITLAHVIANPDPSIYSKLHSDINKNSAIGVLTITPPETAIIIADISIKSADVEIISINIASGSLILSGTVANIEAAIIKVLDYVQNKLGFYVCELTKT